MPPGSTEFSALKFAERSDVVKLSSAAPDALLRNATSDGEFIRVGTCGVENVGGPDVRATLESSGNTR